MKGTQRLDAARLKALRDAKCISQEDLSHACQAKHLRLSLATIKRAEAGRPVSYRTIREFSAFYAVPLSVLTGKSR
ncbi:XRE family transcriptional regulator [Gallaecimonas xiamenensis]|uniref:Cro/Ci family transcriptional regulator n=1 Tax=Gallaecimonas xiamenensis 3-C-1 TaxID=745411 RepID=K2KD22_9GAMM|nr:XRE family transcriptional regulator [Gallaecimonas xiamenensis]EKE75145.1 Cro/Ci family transcriptional regulator [Gallaecimonas xiamenensis 3-C-1]